MKYLNDNRIVYRRYSPDKPTKEYSWGWYYAEGTYGYYSLFNTTAKITTIRSLKWHLLTIWYLNPSMDKKRFNKTAEIISNKDNGFTTFNISNLVLKSLIDDIYTQDIERPPKNKLRKIVFIDGSGLSISEKLSIVGKLIGRKNMIDEESIYQCMINLNDGGKKITIEKIAVLLDCSSRTIHRNMSQQLKNEKDLLNEKV